MFAVTLPVVGYASIVFTRRATPVLSGRAVGDAVLFVCGEHEIVRAGAAVAHPFEVLGRNEAEVGARVVLARIVILQLSQRMVDVNIIRAMSCVVEGLDFLPSELVGPHDGFQVPV